VAKKKKIKAKYAGPEVEWHQKMQAFLGPYSVVSRKGEEGSRPAHALNDAGVGREIKGKEGGGLGDVP